MSRKGHDPDVHPYGDGGSPYVILIQRGRTLNLQQAAARRRTCRPARGTLGWSVLWTLEQAKATSEHASARHPTRPPQFLKRMQSMVHAPCWAPHVCTAHIQRTCMRRPKILVNRDPVPKPSNMAISLTLCPVTHTQAAVWPRPSDGSWNTRFRGPHHRTQVVQVGSKCAAECACPAASARLGSASLVQRTKPSSRPACILPALPVLRQPFPSLFLD